MPGPRDHAPAPPAEPAEGDVRERLARAEQALGKAEARLAEALRDRAALSEELEHARSARLETASILSHDLRNPLSAMLIGVQRLERLVDGPRREQATGVLQKLERSIRGMNRRLEELVDLSRLECGTLALQPREEAVDVVLAAAIEPLRALAAERSQRIEVRCPEGLAAPAWDPGRIAQALEQLVLNAVRYGPEGGTLRVSAEADGAGIRFAVRDDGPGLTAEEQRHLFDRWWRAPAGGGPRGRGLGLFLVRGIVEAHGGRAWVESEEGRGSTFLFTLPLATK